MSALFEQLSARHQRLRLASEVQRGELAVAAAELEERLSGVDRGLAAARKFVNHPAVIMGGLAVLAIIGPRRILSLASRSAMYMSLARALLKKK